MMTTGLRLEHQSLVEQLVQQVQQALQDSMVQQVQQAQLALHQQYLVQLVQQDLQVQLVQLAQSDSQSLLKAPTQITQHLLQTLVEHQVQLVMAGSLLQKILCLCILLIKDGLTLELLLDQQVQLVQDT
jgi:hypothetical protein